MNTKTITLGGVIFLTLLSACGKKPVTAATTTAPPPPREPVVAASRQADPAPARTRQAEATPAPPQSARNNSITADEKARLAAEVERVVWPWIAAGLVKPRLDRTFQLQEAAAAHAYLEGGGHVGKIVLTID